MPIGGHGFIKLRSLSYLQCVQRLWFEVSTSGRTGNNARGDEGFHCRRPERMPRGGHGFDKLNSTSYDLQIEQATIYHALRPAQHQI